MVCFKSLIYCLSCWSVNDCFTCYLCMHRSDYMSLSDSLSLQWVLCFIFTMIELDLDKEWLLDISSTVYHAQVCEWLCYMLSLCMHRSDNLSLSDRVRRCSNTDEGARLRWGMAFGLLFDILVAVYHAKVYIIILLAICFCIGVTLCRCRTAYKGFAVAEAQRES